MKITLELEINDSVIQQYAGEYLPFVQKNLEEEVLCYVVNEMDMHLDDIINTMIKDKEELERGVTA